MSVQNSFRLVSSANTDNATSITTAPSVLYNVSCFNGATPTYLKLYDNFAGAAPASTDIPRLVLYLPANSSLQYECSNGRAMRNLGFRLTTGGADNNTGAVAAGAVLALNIDYT